MPDFEELRIRVVLEDQASGNLSSLRTNLTQLGDPSSPEGRGVQQFGTRLGLLNPVMRTVASGALSARSAMGLMGGAIGPLGVVVAGLGFGAYRTVQSLNKFSEGINSLATQARVVGMDGGVLNNIVKQFQSMGIQRDAAINFSTNFAKSLADMSREGSKLRQQFLQSSGRNSAAMERWLQN